MCVDRIISTNTAAGQNASEQEVDGPSQEVAAGESETGASFELARRGHYQRGRGEG